MNRPWRALGAAGTGLGLAAAALVSQLWWLTSEGWQAPQIRLAAAIVGGMGLGIGLWWVVRKTLGDVWGLGLGMGLGAVGLGTLGAWTLAPGIFGEDWAWVVGAMAVVCVVLAWAGPARVVGRYKGWKSWAGWVVVAAVVAGAGLRLAGIGHGLPHYIMHCDTPKQLERIPWFVRGELDPKSDYPMGHVYLYSGAIAVAKALSGMPGKLASLAPDKVQRAVGYILTARGMQVAMGLGVILLAWAVARGLWGPGAGALAAVLVALDPLHMTYSRQVMGEVPQCVWVWLGTLCGLLLMKGKGRWWALAGGLCAGLGVATKIYGGYALAMVWAGALLAQGRSWKWKASAMAIALMGLAGGIVLGSPYLWVDPAGWWKAVAGQSINQFYTGTSFWERLEAAREGLGYLWGVVWRRYGPVWVVGVGIGIVWVGYRALKGRREELFFGLGLGISLALVLVFRLSYLREWDLVNLVPWVEVAAGGAMASMCRSHLRWARWGVRAVCTAVVGAMILVGVSDAWVAMAPDTRVTARRWVIAHSRPGQSLAWNLTLSGAYAMWLPQKMGLNLDGGGRRWNIGVVEWGWFGRPTPGFRPLKPGPAALFNLRNYFWENPIIACYIRTPTPSPWTLISPPALIHPGGIHYLLTPWARRSPLELAAGWAVDSRGQEAVGVGRLERLGWVALGRGKARLIIGPGIGMPFKVEMGKAAGGIIRPVRALVPVYTRVYKFSLIRTMPAPVVWVGLFPQPVEAAPLAARMGNWPLVHRLAEASLGSERPKRLSPEAWLWAAVGAAATGHPARASTYLERLEKLHPGFAKRYLTLATEGRDKLKALLPELMNMDRGMWQWPVPSDDRAELYQGYQPRYHHMGPAAWVTSGVLMLPGYWRVEASLTTTHEAHMVIIARMGRDWARVLATRRIAPGTSTIQAAFELPCGPAMVELHLSCPLGEVRIKRVRLFPDRQAELRWRVQLVRKWIAPLLLHTP